MKEVYMLTDSRANVMERRWSGDETWESDV
jgi:hypothetical protein